MHGTNGSVKKDWMKNKNKKGVLGGAGSTRSRVSNFGNNEKSQKMIKNVKGYNNRLRMDNRQRLRHNENREALNIALSTDQNSLIGSRRDLGSLRKIPKNEKGSPLRISAKQKNRNRKRPKGWKLFSEMDMKSTKDIVRIHFFCKILGNNKIVFWCPREPI